MAIRMSNNVMAAVSVATLLLSVPVLVAGVWLRSRADGTECGGHHFLSTPAVALGAALMAASLAGLAGACCRATSLLCVYLLATLALLAALLCFTAFAFVVTTTARGDRVRGYDSTWLRRHVEGREHWARIRTCLADARVCRRRLEDKDAASLSPVQSGCCRPPPSCNFTHAGGTEWAKTAGPARADPDCRAWGDDDDELCFGCQSCKAAVVDALKRDWRRAAIVSVVFLAVVVVVYSVGCCAFRNSRRDNYAYHSGRGWKRNGSA